MPTSKEIKYLRQYRKLKHKCICMSKSAEKCCDKCKDMLKLEKQKDVKNKGVKEK